MTERRNSRGELLGPAMFDDRSYDEKQAPSVRRAHDWYPTPLWATAMLIERVPISGDVVEPCSGDGAIAGALRLAGIHVIENDLDPKWKTPLQGDATDPRWWFGLERAPWVVTNPPFGVAPAILPLAVHYATVGVAMLLRLSYLEPCQNRASWLVAHPPARLLVLPRISFTGDGKTDSVTCAWFVWGVAPLGVEVVPDTPTGQLSLVDLPPGRRLMS